MINVGERGGGGGGGGGGARFRDDEHAKLIGAANLLRFLSKKVVWV